MLIDDAPQPARRAVQTALVLATALLLVPTAAPAESGRQRAVTGDSVPHGLVVVRASAPQGGRASDLQAALNNPSISGVAFQITWRDIEPVEGQLDWSKLDELFAAAEASKKWVHLLIFPGFGAPAWALEGANTDMFAIRYGPGKGTVQTLPMPWDKTYLSRWFVFLKQLSDRYGKSPAFRMIAAAGPTSVSAEMSLPNTPQDVQTWVKDSYTPGKYVGAWQEVFRAYAAEFPNQYISLSMYPGLPINDRGKRDGREHLDTRQEVIDAAIGLLGHRFALQASNLNAGPDVSGTNFVRDYSGRSITGFQMRTSAERSSAEMGVAGDPSGALKESITKGMQPNGAGRHVNYLEIYEGDVVADDMQSVLQYGASLFAH